MSAQGCRVCGGYGEGTTLGSRYDKTKRVVWISYQVEHRNQIVHRYEVTNLPRTDERYEWKEQPK